MQLKLAGEFFEQGVLSHCVICSYPRSTGWLLQFTTVTGGTLTLQSQRGKDPRCFKTLDAACEVAFKIGFQSVTVNKVSK